VTRDEGNEQYLEVEDQKALLVGIALVDVGSVLKKVRESQEITLERHGEARVFPRRSEIFNGLLDREELQPVDIHNRLVELLSKPPPQELLADGLEVEEKDRRGHNQDQGRHEYSSPLRRFLLGFPFWVPEWHTVHPGISFIKLTATVIASSTAACLFNIAHFGGQSIWRLDLPLVQPIL